MSNDPFWEVDRCLSRELLCARFLAVFRQLCRTTRSGKSTVACYQPRMMGREEIKGAACMGDMQGAVSQAIGASFTRNFLWLLTALESTSCGPSAGEPVQKVHVEFKNRWKTGALRGIFAL